APPTLLARLATVPDADPGNGQGPPRGRDRDQQPRIAGGLSEKPPALPRGPFGFLVASQAVGNAGDPHPNPLPEGEGVPKDRPPLPEGEGVPKDRPPLPPGEGWGEGDSGERMPSEGSFHHTGTPPSPRRAWE